MGESLKVGSVKGSQQDNSPLERGALDILGGSKVQRAEETKRIIFTMKGQAISILLEGFWDGQLLRAATNKIERYYRGLKQQRLREAVSANAGIAKKETGNG